MTKKKHCVCCNCDVTSQNFATHKKTTKHLKNKANYKPINLLDNIKDEKCEIKYLKLELEEIKTNIDNILKNIV